MSLRELDAAGLTPSAFQHEIVAAARPVVMRGLCSNWPAVRAAVQSDEALMAYLGRFDRGQRVNAMMGSPGIGGRFHYNADLSGFNFRLSPVQLGAALDLLMQYRTEAHPPSLAVQSVPMREHMPAFEAENRMPLLGDAVEPRAWLGNAVIVAAHHDPSENIACVVAGRRRFTLFAPDQISNLYMGPFELTPAGPAISMVDFDDPDLERYPRFADALETALIVDLEPGDALYIPYLWWHHVRSMDPVNMLVNYWWAPPDGGRGRPMDALMHAMLAVRDLPPPHREAWRSLFDHFVFEDHGGAGDHLKPERRGVIGAIDPATARSIRAAIARSLARP